MRRQLKFLNFLYDYGFYDDDGQGFDGTLYLQGIKKIPSDKITDIVNKLANEEVEFKDIDVETAMELSKLLKISVNDIYDCVYLDQKYLAYIAVYANIENAIRDTEKTFKEIKNDPHDFESDENFESDEDYIDLLKYEVEELERTHQAIRQLVVVFRTAPVCGIEANKISRLMWNINVLKDEINDFCIKEYGKEVLNDIENDKDDYEIEM
ncbi:MAG: hypothetical protein ACLRYM_14930 [Thomasclavelia ramosa]